MEQGLGYIVAAVIVVFIVRRLMDKKPNGSLARVVEFLVSAGAAAGAVAWQYLGLGG